MSAFMIDVKSKIFNFHYEFDRRLNVIKGDSGTGKTTLVSMLTSKILGVEKETTYKPILATEEHWSDDIKTKKDRIFIFDDLYVVETPLFASLYSEYAVRNNLYFIIISRENLSLRSMGRLSFSVNSIFEMEFDGTNNYTLRKHYSFGTNL